MSDPVTTQAGHDRAYRRDRAQLLDLIDRYFAGVDWRQWDLVADCFIASAAFALAGAPGAPASLSEGRDAIVATLRGMERFASSTHTRCNTVITTASGHATGLITATAMAEITPTDGTSTGVLHYRGLRYRDTYVRTAQGWKIERRTLIRTWQTQLPAVPPSPAFED